MQHVPLAAALALAAALVPLGAAAQAWSCDGGAVEIGDPRYDVRARCGEPTLVDATRVTRIGEDRGGLVAELVDVEDWLYDRGPDRLVVVLTFERDRLIGARGFGYGRAPGERPAFDKVVEDGAPTVRVLFLYGPPAHEEERIETTVVSRKGAAIPRQRTIATWTYNLGPSRFQRIFHFVDGRLARVEQGPRGF